MMNELVNFARKYKSPIAVSLVALLAFSFVLTVHGAVPFLMSPTLGQAIWSMGFSESFINPNFFSIYANNFGIPEPQPIPFGLSGALVASAYLALGLQSADAYSAMVLSWLAVAFYGAFRIARMIGVNHLLAIACAVLWLSLPVTWGHRGYSMVSLGISLLPLYFLVSLQVLDSNFLRQATPARLLAKFVLICVISVFMDGYSYIMFFFGTTLLVAHRLATDQTARKRILTFSTPIYVVGFFLSALCYKLYVRGMGPETSHHIDFFRGMGVDLTFIVAPSAGKHLIWDMLGWSTPRNGHIYYGDG